MLFNREKAVSLCSENEVFELDNTAARPSGRQWFNGSQAGDSLTEWTAEKKIDIDTWLVAHRFTTNNEDVAILDGLSVQEITSPPAGYSIREP